MDLPSLPLPRPSSSPGRSVAPFLNALAIAGQQHGVLSRCQTEEAGLSKSNVRSLRHNGTLGNPCAGVYSVRSLIDPSDRDAFLRTSVMAAQLALGPRSFAGGRKAAYLWGIRGLPRWDRRTVHMVVPGPGTKRRRHHITLHTWQVATEEITTLDGVLRLTTPGRSLRDTLLSVDRETAVCLMDSALHQGLIEKGQVGALILANRKRKGCVRSRRWWPLADGRAESPLEPRVRLPCTDAGFPPTDLQHRFLDDTGRTIAVADLWWAEMGIIGEADGHGPHSLPKMLAKDRVRQNSLQVWHPGVRIVRFTWQDLKRPGYIASVLAQAAGRG